MKQESGQRISRIAQHLKWGVNCLVFGRSLPRALLVGLGIVCLTHLPVSRADGPLRVLSMELVDVDNDGLNGVPYYDGQSAVGAPAINTNGKYIAFRSYATNLGYGFHSPYSHIFLRDRMNLVTEHVSFGIFDYYGGDLGLENQTLSPLRFLSLVESDTTNLRAADGNSQEPSISNDGRYVVFSSSARNLVLDDGNIYSDIFLFDRIEGIATRLSITPSGEDANGNSFNAAISGNGQFVVFFTEATNLTPGGNNPKRYRLVLHNLWSGEVEKIVELNTSFLPYDQDFDLSEDGRYIVFESDDALFEGDEGEEVNIYLYDRESHSLKSLTNGNGGSSPKISNDGNFVVFANYDSIGSAITRYDRIHETKERVNVFITPYGDDSRSRSPDLDASGDMVTFTSNSDLLTSDEVYSVDQVFLRQMSTNTTILLSQSLEGIPGNEMSFSPRISGDGGSIVFMTGSSNLRGNTFGNHFYLVSIDQCLDDPNKVMPGTCGCGTSDTDSDGDGTVDCLEICISDPDKLTPGACGCGIPDSDGDSDGVLNCFDSCPNDGAKLLPGLCGCGSVDTDSDLDGTPDCSDLCPLDPGKIASGSCGCGVVEDARDVDRDHLLNCQDTDDDGDSLTDLDEGLHGTNPNLSDSDADGLTDSEELVLGTNPLEADSDGDRVDDGDELDVGSAPLDPGSVALPIPVKLCGFWSSYLKMHEFLEVIARNEKSPRSKVTIYDMFGNELARAGCKLGRGQECDFDISALNPSSSERYGMICLSHNSGLDAVDARVTSYGAGAIATSVSGAAGESSFAHASSLVEGRAGTQSVWFNSLALGTIRAEDWIQLINAGETEARGEMQFYSRDGALLRTLRLKVPARGRVDTSIQTYVGISAGQVLWIPDLLTSRFIIQSLRFFEDAPGHYVGSISHSGGVGSEQPRVVPVERGAVLEILNCGDQAAIADLVMFDENGNERIRKEISLNSFGSSHQATWREFEGAIMGIAKLVPRNNQPMRMSSISYLRTEAGVLWGTYALDAIEPIGNNYYANYNTMLQQADTIYVINGRSAPRSGRFLLNSLDDVDLSIFNLALSPHQLASFNLGRVIPNDRYGVVKLTSNEMASVGGWLIRKRPGSFALGLALR